MSGQNSFEATQRIRRRVQLCDYLAVAQIYLQDNFLLARELKPEDIKPRLLGHWGTCHGINVAYANLKAYFGDGKVRRDAGRDEGELGNGDFAFILGPGHGFPALQANLWLDGELAKVDTRATLDKAGVKYICKNFSWPDGFPSHASPITPGIITEGGELGYALANAYGLALGHPKKTVAILIGDGELETATAIDSLNLRNLLSGTTNGRVLPILHLNGYKISAPSIYARKSERELNELFRGFGYTPVIIDGDAPGKFQEALNKEVEAPFYILKTEKGDTGPNRHQAAHQVPLKNPKTDKDELGKLQEWLKSYGVDELFDEIIETKTSLGGKKGEVKTKGNMEIKND